MKKSGNWPPEGLDYHVALRPNGDLRASEIWDSRPQVDAFGEEGYARAAGDIVRAYRAAAVETLLTAANA